MSDPFLDLLRQNKVPAAWKSVPRAAGHGERAHSKFSASGSDRWHNCPGSVEISEGIPDKSSPYAEEGTCAHEVLEGFMRVELSGNDGAAVDEYLSICREARARYGPSIINITEKAGRFIFMIAGRHPGAEVLCEQKVFLDFIHPAMFGTFDGAVVDHFETLHVFDFKYGAGVAVSVKENLQMIFYGLGLAHRYRWNFKRVRLWIIQPRIKGYDGPTWWDLTIDELRGWESRFRAAVTRVLNEPDTFVEGSWCHWCKAKSVCPKKREAKLEHAKMVFSVQPVNVTRTRWENGEMVAINGERLR